MAKQLVDSIALGFCWRPTASGPVEFLTFWPLGPANSRHNIQLKAAEPALRNHSATLYLIAQIMADAPWDAFWHRVMAPDTLVNELVKQGTPVDDARMTIGLAWNLELHWLETTAAANQYPTVVTDTVWLRRIQNGDFEGLLGPRPADKPATPKSDRGATVNTRVINLLTARPEATGWSAREFAVALGCGKSTVAACPAYKKLDTARGLARLERAEKAQQSNQRQEPK
jgi:hypothetical protein